MDTWKSPAAVALTTSEQTLFTATATCMVEVIVANVDGANAANVTLKWTDDSAAAAEGHLCLGAEVAAGDVLVSPRKTLDAGDTIVGEASADGDLEASLNVWEFGS